MNFDDIIDILFDGDKKQMESVCCNKCGGRINYDIEENKSSMRIQCVQCGTRVNMGKLAEIPNCLDIFGNSYTFNNIKV